MVDLRTVLLADDVELFLELEKIFFRRANFGLLVARNGREAYEIIAEQRPDMAFLDLYMPEMSGDDCCRRVKADPELSSIPIAMVTHGGRDANMRRCHDAGCDDVVLKPINRHSFLNAARKFPGVRDREAPRVRASSLIWAISASTSKTSSFSLPGRDRVVQKFQRPFAIAGGLFFSDL